MENSRSALTLNLPDAIESFKIYQLADEYSPNTSMQAMFFSLHCFLGHSTLGGTVRHISIAFSDMEEVHHRVCIVAA
jgi:hypothetical protein